MRRVRPRSCRAGEERVRVRGPAAAPRWRPPPPPIAVCIHRSPSTTMTSWGRRAWLRHDSPHELRCSPLVQRRITTDSSHSSSARLRHRSRRLSITSALDRRSRGIEPDRPPPARCLVPALLRRHPNPRHRPPNHRDARAPYAVRRTPSLAHYPSPMPRWRWRRGCRRPRRLSGRAGSSVTVRDHVSCPPRLHANPPRSSLADDFDHTMTPTPGTLPQHEHRRHATPRRHEASP